MNYKEATEAAFQGRLILRAGWKHERGWLGSFVCQRRKQRRLADPNELIWLRGGWECGGWSTWEWVPEEEDLQAIDWETASKEDEDYLGWLICKDSIKTDGDDPNQTPA